MLIKNADLRATAYNESQYPSDARSEIAFVGKSNVGKSSLINTLVNRKGLARTSSQPGKTRSINFYNIDERFYFVDLPGYGYAKVSKAEQAKWGKFIEKYLKTREQLVGIIMLIDIRHEPGANDFQMFEWIKHFGYNTVIVCTKSDKLSKQQQKKNIEIIRKALKLTEDDKMVAFSAETRQGKEELLKLIDGLAAEEEEV